MAQTPFTIVVIATTFSVLFFLARVMVEPLLVRFVRPEALVSNPNLSEAFYFILDSTSSAGVLV